jgi:VanZ family protein
LFVVCCAVVVGAFGLEYLQTFTPDRHATLVDACEKASGGVLGIAAARATVRSILRHKQSENQA